MGFDGSPLVVTRGHGGPDDKTPTMLGNLNVGAMLSPAALAQTVGTDVELIHGPQWQDRTGDRMMILHGTSTGIVWGDENWTIEQDLNFVVNGKTYDSRVGDHYQFNTNPRFDTFIHTRTETHYQPQVIHQPTKDTHTIWQKLETNWEKHAFTFFYLTGNAIKIEVDGLEATEKVIVLERKEFRCQNDPIKFTLGDVRVKVWGFITETAPAKLYVAAGHVKAVATNIAAGIRAAFSAPWGS